MNVILANIHAMIIRAGYLLAFILPLNSLFFLLTGPHGILAAIAWTTPFWLILLADWIFQDRIQKNPVTRHIQFYDSILFGLSFLQLANIILMLSVVAQFNWQTQDEVIRNLVNLLIIRFLVGTSSGTSGIVVAHELIHRPQVSMQLLGKLLLSTVCYGHFVITHTRGHHLGMDMPDDIATGQLDESFNDYWKRVFIGHIRYSWQSENFRLSRLNGSSYLYKILLNKVFQGITFEVVIILLILIYFGWLAVLIFIYQAFAAIRILEAVNYFQHWGLNDEKYANSFGWVNNSPISRYALIGLSNHIGHHQDDQKKYYEIEYSNQGPKMPFGYFVMNFWVKLNNISYKKIALQELQNYCKEINTKL